MRNAVDWSYDLLDAREQALLHRLGVFAGSFDLAAAEAIAVGADLDVLDVVDLVGQLVDKSLVAAETRRAQTRYRLFETIRDYAWERLEQAGEVEEFSFRHAVHFVDLAEDANVGLSGPDEAEWIERVRDELDNLHAALRWAIVAEQPDLALRLVTGLTVAASPAANPFGVLAEQAAAMPSAEGHELRPVALTSAAYGARSGDFEHAVAVAEAAVDLANLGPEDTGHVRVRCVALGALGSLLLSAGVPIDAHRREVVEELLTLARRIGDDQLLATALNLSMPCHPESALALAEEALECAERTRNPSRLAFSLVLYALMVGRTDSERAHRCLEAALVYASEVGNRMATDYVLQTLAAVEAADGNFHAAGTTLVACIERALWTGNQTVLQLLFDNMARTLAVLGASDTSLLVTAWLQRRDVAIDNEQLRDATAPQLFEDYERLLRDASDEQCRAAARAAASMTDREVLDVARAALESAP